MDSALDSIAALEDRSSAPRSWTARARMHLRGALSWLGLSPAASDSGRLRRMHIDVARSAALGAGAVLLAALAAMAHTWYQHGRAAEQQAQRAAEFVSARLGTIGAEMSRLAAHPDLQTPPAPACTETLVDALLHESLASLMVRRFEVTAAGVALRCGPQGQRPAEALAVQPGSGLRLLTGQSIAAKPMLMLHLPNSNGGALLATLDNNALQLESQATVPAQRDDLAAAVRITLRSDTGQALLVAGARQNFKHPVQALQARSALEQAGLHITAEVDEAQLTRNMLRDALWVVAVVLPVLLALVAMVWRRAMLRARLVHRLERALRKRQFVPFVQPIVDLATGRCVGGEVLMRWNHPQRGILGPGEFIDEAERTGLIVGMSELTMSLAAHQLAALAQSNPELYFSFNITPDQLRLPGFARRLAEIFNPDTVPRQQVLLELTERDFVDPVAKGQLIALRADGWRIAIDDFGTGQSSLATIESLPIDRIKIDRAFVSSIDERTLSRPVLDAIINLAHELHVPLIAEGIETRSQWDYLAARNVAYAQGYLMSKPLPVADFIRFATHSDRSVAQAPNTAAKPAQKPVNDQALQALWQQLGSTGGVEVRNRQYLLRTYANCFVGSEALDWIVQQRGVPRSEALRLARAMVAVGLVHHVVDEHDFEDAGFFYRLAPSTQTTPVTPAPEAAALRQALHQALDFPWRDHCVGLLRHRRCATGRTVVDWIVQRYPAPRAHAVAWATQLMRQGALRHVFDDQPFRDDASLYRLS